MSPPAGGPADLPAADTRAAELCEAALAGDRRSLARLLTAVENRTPVAEAALRRLYPLAGHAHLIGITGPPGAGKSTLVAALVGELRAAGRTVAVVAVDPSSPITGGAILGDRVRMQAYAGDRDVFIRSMAARGHAGGLASTTGAACAVLDAAGFEIVMIETVGTGQSEVEVAAAADTTVVLEAPEMGDEIQAIKAGLLEVADLVVVNKGDRPGAQRTASQLRAMLGGGRRGQHGPPVLITTAATGAGVPELLAAIDRRRAEGALRRRRRDPPGPGRGRGPWSAGRSDRTPACRTGDGRGPRDGRPRRGGPQDRSLHRRRRAARGAGRAGRPSGSGALGCADDDQSSLRGRRRA